MTGPVKVMTLLMIGCALVSFVCAEDMPENSIRAAARNLTTEENAERIVHAMSKVAKSRAFKRGSMAVAAGSVMDYWWERCCVKERHE